MSVNLSSSTPAAVSGKTNVGFQLDGSGNVSGQVQSVGTAVVKTTSYTLSAADTGKLIVFSGTSLTCTLPAAPPSASWEVTISDLDATSLTINRNGLTIDNLSANRTVAQFGSCRIFTDGTNYFLARGAGIS